MNTGWSWYVIALVALNIIGCLWLIWWTGKRKPGDPAPTDTSHIWDGDLTEYNQPMPRWWINLFYLTIAFGIGYLIYYPGLGAFAGIGKWSSAKKHDAEQAIQDRTLAATFKQYEGKAIDVLAQDPKALKLGRSIFSNNCAICHGSSAHGAIGYPDLSDNIWHWGGSPERVLQTILDGREGVMPVWGTILTGMGGEHAVDNTIAYLRSLSPKNTSPQNEEMVARGKTLYQGVCVGCHGPGGKGNITMGAPDLTDTYWLYGNSDEALHKTIAEGRNNVMPAHRDLLGETRARLVAAYVWSLSHTSHQ